MEVCEVYHVLRWCRRNQDGGTDYLFFYIEFFYTSLIFLRLRNTKEMHGFFREEDPNIETTTTAVNVNLSHGWLGI
jgi:hypothetical protein